MPQPLLSVIVPCYNVEKYIDKCVSSIVVQTYSNLEILLIDDGSTDKTGMRCDVWQEKDQRIRVIHQQNKGVSFARNSGIKNATAEYITFVDSDDWITPEMYANLMQTLLSTGSDIVQCGYCKVFDDGRIEPGKTEKKTGLFELFGKKEGVLMILDGRIWESFLWNKIFKSRLFEHIEFPVGRVYEDPAVMYSLFHHASQSVYLYEDHYFYFQSSESITRDIKMERKMQGRYDFYNMYYDRTKFVEQHQEYHSILLYIRNLEMYAGMYALRDAVVYPQYFPNNYFESLSGRLKTYPFSLRPKHLHFSPFPAKAVIPYFIVVELIILRINSLFYKKFRLFYSRYPKIEKFLFRFDGFSISKYLKKLKLIQGK